jgi:aspartyl/asparaginyl-tRNA synthetase
LTKDANKVALAHEYNGPCNAIKYNCDGQKEASNCFHKKYLVAVVVVIKYPKYLLLRTKT